jgi:DNA-binding LytR/AlgR family response regulator
MMKILIIEDEPFAQQELVRLLRQAGLDFQLLATIDTIEESVEWFQSNPAPDLVFLDIQLADGISFDIFRQVKMESPVIFTTAYDEYAIRAFQLNSIDYLLKPIKPGELKTALDKLAGMKQQFSDAKGHITDDQLDKLLNMVTGHTYKTRFLVKLGDELKSIDTAEIAYFKAEDNVVFLFTVKGKRYIIEHTLEELEQQVDPSEYFRLNRSFLASMKSIKKINKYFNSRLALELEPATEEKVIISRRKVQPFLEWLEA